MILKFSNILCKTLFFLSGIVIPLSTQAENLSDQLQNLFGGGITIGDEFHEAHFNSSSNATLSLLTTQLSTSAVDIPAISTVPGLTYRYNQALQTFERSSGTLGSIYIERPLTLGKGNLEFGFSYTYVGFDTLDGNELEGRTDYLNHDDCCAPFNGDDDPRFEQAQVALHYDKFSLQSHIFNFSSTYGITDNWDVNLLVPVMETSLDVDVSAQIINDPKPFGFFQGHFFPNGTKTLTKSTSGSHFGVGDIQLRTKYHFFSYDWFNMAGGISLRLPSGSVENFQGVGDTTVLPYLSFSGEYGIIDLHATAGVEFNTGNDLRDRIRYAGGATFQIIPELAFITDFIGTSNIRTNQISVATPQFHNDPIPGNPLNKVRIEDEIHTATVNSDTLDLALGFKFVPAKSVVGYFNVFIPLNDEGLRADVIPTGGVQVGF